MTLKRVLPIVATIALLVGLHVQKLSFPTEADAAPYHESVKAAVALIPDTIDGWVSQDAPMPPQALALLKPNAMFSRKYVNSQTGKQVDLLVVQCRTARDMAGHYPPRCYPANGWKLRSFTRKQWTVLGQTIPAMQYEFYQAFATRSSKMIVINALILPDGIIVRDMEAVGRLASDYQKHVFGAGQLQVVFGPEIPENQRDDVVRKFLAAAMPAIKTIQSGVEP